MYITCIMSTIFLIHFTLRNVICIDNYYINIPVMGTGNYYYTYFYYEE
jgi:hypothetical protein